MIVRHQRPSSSAKGFRPLAHYIRGRANDSRATWFHAENLPGVSNEGDLELACALVDAIQVQNTRAGNDRTYHMVISFHPDDRKLDTNELRHVVEELVDVLGFSEHQHIAVRHNDKAHEHVHVAINKIHPETLRIHAPAWDHRKLFTKARSLETELELTPLRVSTRERDSMPQRAADCEAHQGIESFARWARKTLGPALHAAEARSWDEVHDVCARHGVALRLHGNGLVFEDVEDSVRVKASLVGREFSKPQLGRRLGDFQPPSSHHRAAAAHPLRRYSPVPARVPQSLWHEYAKSLEQSRLQREQGWKAYREMADRAWQQMNTKYRRRYGVMSALPISGADKKQVGNQLSLQRSIAKQNLKAKLARERKAIQKTPHPGTWRHFVASRASEGDARAIRVLQRAGRRRDGRSLGRER